MKHLLTLLLFFYSSTAFAQIELKTFAKESGELFKKATRLASSQKQLRALPHISNDHKLFKWVKKSIRYEPYSGSLRSPEGVLVSGGGNSIDIARMLGKEFKSRGKKVRYATVEWTEKERRRIGRSFVGRATLVSQSPLEESNDLRNNPIPRERVYLEVFNKGVWTPFDPIVDPFLGKKKSPPIAVEDELGRSQMGTIEITIAAEFTDGQKRTLFTTDTLLNKIGVSDWQLAFEPSPTMEGNIVPLLTVGLDEKKADDFPPEQLKRLSLSVTIRQDNFQTRNESVLFEKKDKLSFVAKNAVYSIHLFGSWLDFDWASTQVASQLMKVSNALQGWSGDAFAEKPSMKKRRFVKWLNVARKGLGAALAFAYIGSLDVITRDLARTFGVQPFIGEPRIVLVSSVPGKKGLLFRIESLTGKIDSQSKIGIPRGASQGFHTLFGVLESNLRSQSEAFFSGEKPWFNPQLDLKTLEKVGAKTRGLNPGDRRRIRRDARAGNLILSTLPLLDSKGWWALLPESGTIQSKRTNPHNDLLSRSQKVSNIVLAEYLLSFGQKTLHFFQGKKPLQKSKRAVCKSFKDLKHLAQTFCAIDKPLPPPSLLRCIELKAEDDSVMNGSCRERTEYFRCGAVFSSALLGKKMTVMYTKDQTPFEILQATKKTKRKRPPTGITCR